AAMRVFGILANADMSARHRPPVPMQPTFIVSLAPRALTAGTPNAAAAVEAFRNERRETVGRGKVAPRLLVNTRNIVGSISGLDASNTYQTTPACAAKHLDGVRAC